MSHFDLSLFAHRQLPVNVSLSFIPWLEYDDSLWSLKISLLCIIALPGAHLTAQLSFFMCHLCGSVIKPQKCRPICKVMMIGTLRSMDLKMYREYKQQGDCCNKLHHQACPCMKNLLLIFVMNLRGHPRF